MTLDFFLWTLGAALAFAAGNILQKMGLVRALHKTDAESVGAQVGGVLRNFHWWGGMGLSAIATLLYYGAMARWNLSLVQPMLSLNPALTALVGWLWLREQLDARTALAIAACALGLIAAGTLAGEVAGVQNLPRLWAFLGAFAVVAAVLPKLHLSREVLYSAYCGAGFGLSAVLWKSLSLVAQTPVDYLLQWQTYVFVFTYIGSFITSQIALAQGRVLFVIPFSAALGAALPIVAGGFVFGDPFPPAKWVAAGLVLTGSALFIRRPPGSPRADC